MKQLGLENRKSGFIAIVGRPNSGKSTLLNSVLDSQLSIVTPKAQTTRQNVLGILTENQGQIVFVDTPGIHRAREQSINAYMVQQAREALTETAVVWYLVDPSSALKHERTVLDLLREYESLSRIPIYLLFNKSDLVPGEVLEKNLMRLKAELLSAMNDGGFKVKAVMMISALKKTGLDDLLSQTWELLPAGPFHFPDEEQLSDRPTRFFVAENIREQLFLRLGDELPYSCAVEIQRFDEKTEPVRIEAIIYVERHSQKGMVIGREGKKIKEIGIFSRQKIEELIGVPVFLGLKVKVLKDWSQDAHALRRLGYHLPKRIFAT